jgi:hypothetical protein
MQQHPYLRLLLFLLFFFFFAGGKNQSQKKKSPLQKNTNAAAATKLTKTFAGRRRRIPMRSKSKGRCWRWSEDAASDEGKRREKRETIA